MTRRTTRPVLLGRRLGFGGWVGGPGCDGRVGVGLGQPKNGSHEGGGDGLGGTAVQTFVGANGAPHVAPNG